MELLSAESLNVVLRARPARPILYDLTLRVASGEVVGLVGESGSGKSMLALAAMGLLPNQLVIAGGSLRLLSRDVRTHGIDTLNDLRGSHVSIVFQEPSKALNPRLRVGEQLSEVLIRHRRMRRREAIQHSVDLLAQMLIADPSRIAGSFPSHLSGGQRQRVLLALALACDVKLLIADEPTTALDVSTQTHVLHLIRQRAAKSGMGVLLISHNLGLIQSFCDRLYVLYAGTVLEQGDVEVLGRRPAHPYTRALLNALPDNAPPRSRLATIPGSSSTRGITDGACPFAERCSDRVGICATIPKVEQLEKSFAHSVRCWRAEGVRTP